MVHTDSPHPLQYVFCGGGQRWVSGQCCAGVHLGGLAPNVGMVVVVSLGALGWHLVLTQLQRPTLATGLAPGLWQGWGKSQAASVLHLYSYRDFG